MLEQAVPMGLKYPLRVYLYRPTLLVFMKTSSSLLFLFLTCSVALAADPQATIGEPGCLVINTSPGPDERITWSGGCKDGFASGKGVLQWYAKDVPGTHYEGAMENGQPHGVGIMTRKSGDKVEGEFKNGLIDGQVKIAYSNGVKYEGDAKKGVPDGHGAMVFPNKTRYVGDFKNGRPDGRGVYVVANGTRYEGEVQNGKRNGKGVLRNENGDEYQGEFKDGAIDGIGSMVFMSGGRYEGSWKRNQFDGKGTITYAGSGKTVEGEFKDGLPLGATRTTPSTTKYSMKEDDPALGTNIRRPIVTGGGLPFNKTYAELTPDEKQVLSLQYPALEEGDEPPFPLHGLKTVYRGLSALAGKLRAEGHLVLYVKVDAEGKAKSVSVVASPSTEMTDYAAALVMVEKYKTAVCGGKPCEMPFKFSLNMTLTP